MLSSFHRKPYSLSIVLCFHCDWEWKHDEECKSPVEIVHSHGDWECPKENRAGGFLEFAIFGAKKRPKTLVIPAGKEGEGLILFADALAATTVGQEKSSLPLATSSPVIVPGENPAGRVTDILSSSAAVSKGVAAVSNSTKTIDNLNWIVLWGLETKYWEFDTLIKLRKLIPGAVTISPFISNRSDLVVGIEGSQEN